MTEEPRDERQLERDEPEDGDEDEISLDELGEEAATIFDRAGRQEDAPRPQG